MKRWKYVRAALSQAGYTTTESAKGVVLDKIDVVDDNYYVYYTDENGDYVRSRYGDVNSPIIVNPTTETIHITSTVNYLAGISGYTTNIQVKNENNVDVTTSHTTYTTSHSNVVTVSKTGLLTAVASGTSLITAYHNGTATASTSITVGPFVDTLSHNPATATITSAGTYTANHWVNSLGQSIPVTQLTLTLSASPKGTIDASGLFTANATGTTTVTATDKVKTSVSGTIVITTTH